MLELEAAVRDRAAPLLELCSQHGVPNSKVRHPRARGGRRCAGLQRGWPGDAYLSAPAPPQSTSHDLKNQSAVTR